MDLNRIPAPASDDALHAPPIPKQGLATPMRLILARYLGEGILPIGDSILLKCATATGLQTIEFSVDRGQFYTVRCDDAAVISAARHIEQHNALDSLLERFDNLEWCWDEVDGHYLFSRSNSFADAADRLLLMREAAVSLIAYATAMRNHGMGGGEALVGR